MNNKLKFLFSVFTLSFLIFMSIFSAVLIFQIPKQNSSVPLEIKTEVVLDYNQETEEHYYLYSYNIIRWQFHTNDTSIRITLYGMHNSTYHSHSGVVYVLANSTLHSGDWEPPSEDLWYFVFKNEDSDQKPVLLTYTMTPPAEIPGFEISIVLFSIILIVIFGSIFFSRKRIKLNFKYEK